jgi:NmrA-like family
MNHLSRSVAVAGGTGDIGAYISRALLSSTWRPSFSEIRILTRNVSSATARELQLLGGILIRVDFTQKSTVVEAIEGCDVVVNAVGSKGHGPEAREVIARAVVETSTVKLYLPSEYGIDHRRRDFSVCLSILIFPSPSLSFLLLSKLFAHRGSPAPRMGPQD